MVRVELDPSLYRGICIQMSQRIDRWLSMAAGVGAICAVAISLCARIRSFEDGSHAPPVTAWQPGTGVLGGCTDAPRDSHLLLLDLRGVLEAATRAEEPVAVEACRHDSTAAFVR